MTGRVFEIKRFAVHDGDGIRTTVFLKGCPLKCTWCHNPEGLSKEPELAYYVHKCINCGQCVPVCKNGAHTLRDGVHLFDRDKCIGCGLCEGACIGGALTLYGRDVTVDELLPSLLEDRVFYESSGGGVTVSGGECLASFEFLLELLSKLKENGIHTAVDTSGLAPRSSLELILPYTDVFLYDIKAIDEDVHRKCTGVSNSLILDNLLFLDGAGAKIEVRIPYVPGCNDGEMGKIARFLSGLCGVKKIRLLPYHSFARSKYEALEKEVTLPSVIPTKEELEKARELIRKISGKGVE